MTQPESSPQSSLQDLNDFVLYFDDQEQTPDSLTDDEIIEILSAPEGPGLTDSQVEALLNSFVAAGDMHTGAMIALRPSAGDLANLSAYADEPMDELHCTLLYLGDAALIMPDVQDAITGIAASFADMKPVRAEGTDITVFNPGKEESCIVLGVGGSTELIAMRDAIFTRVQSIMKQALPPQHIPYKPHVTLAYTDDTSLVSQLTHLTGPITFDAIRVAFGGEIIDIEFEGGYEDD